MRALAGEFRRAAEPPAQDRAGDESGRPTGRPDGKTLPYLNFPEDTTQLHAIRELTPDTNADKLVAKTSQFAAFGCNRDTSVFVGASAQCGVAHGADSAARHAPRVDAVRAQSSATPARPCPHVFAGQPEDLFPERPRRQAGDLLRARG